jgi:hypothetical protein
MDSAFETPHKSFQILCQEKNKDDYCRPYRLDRRISTVERKIPTILRLLNRPARHIFAIHATPMI